MQVSPTWHPSFLEKVSKPQKRSGNFAALKPRVSGIATLQSLHFLKHRIIAMFVMILPIPSPYCKTSQKIKFEEFNVKKEDALLFYGLLFFFFFNAPCHLLSLLHLHSTPVLFFSSVLCALIITSCNWMRCCFSEADILVTFALLLLSHIERGKRMTMEELESK